MMREWTENIQINKVGGTVGEDSKNYHVFLLSLWMKQLGIDEDYREVFS